MSIAITDSFMESIFQLDKKTRKYTIATIRSIEENPKSDALKIHKIDKCKCDDSFRSARVNDDLRIIFSQNGEKKILLYVGHHEDAYNWCSGKYLGKTDFGAEMIYSTVEAGLREVKSHDNPFDFSFSEPLLAKQDIKEKQLKKLGIPDIHAANLLKITDENEFLDYIQIFPAEIQEGLLSLAAGEKSFDEVYNSLIDEDFNSGKTSEHRDTQRRFHMLQSLDELEALLNSDDFEAWTVFLHPDQEKLVKMNFHGPALVEGGPGTGKTIVGLHRAVYLSQHQFRKDDNKRILFCTFSRKLAKSISGKLELLLGKDGAKNSNIDVLSVDAYIRKMYVEAYHAEPVLEDKRILNLLRDLYSRIHPSGSRAFYEYEYREIVEKYHITTLDEYLAVDRTGGNVPLTQKQRMTAWKFFDVFMQEKKNQHLISFVDLAHFVLRAIEAGKLEPSYDSIIIDEAQDLEPVKLRLLAKSVHAGDNNVFILSDLNQRIYKLSSWKKDSGINIVGRTYYLSINYRTTKQISDYARLQFINSDIVTDHIKEYKSIVNGVPPIVEGFKDDLSQRKFIVQYIQSVGSNCPPEQICVVCPTLADCNQIESILKYESVNCTTLIKDMLPSSKQGVSICPINGVKGLEFRIVIIYNYNNIEGCRFSEDTLPAVKDNYLKLAECSKYVAATRARDELVITYIEAEEE